MNLLAIDSTTENLFVAVESNGQRFCKSFFDNRNKHSELLCLAIADVLESATLTLKDIDACAVCVGPGSFTGIRIGVATAKGFETALGTKLIAVNNLAFLCYVENKQSAVIDAGNGWYFGTVKHFEICQQQLVPYEFSQVESSAQFDSKKDYCQSLLDYAKILYQQQKFTQQLQPVYIRKSQAEIAKEASNLK